MEEQLINTAITPLVLNEETSDSEETIHSIMLKETVYFRADQTFEKRHCREGDHC